MVVLESMLTCPRCAFSKAETMPTDACQVRYVCTLCAETFLPKPGDCCVFCSYGTVPCPPRQLDGSCDRNATNEKRRQLES